MLLKKKLIKFLLILNVGLIIAKVIGSIPTPKADLYILSLFETTNIFQVSNWLILLTASSAIVCTYFTKKNKRGK